MGQEHLNLRCSFCSYTQLFLYIIHYWPSHYFFIFLSIHCFLKYPLQLRLMSLLPFLYLPKTWSSQCHIAEGRTQIALTSVLTIHYLCHINFLIPLTPKNLQPCHWGINIIAAQQLICDFTTNKLRAVIAPFTVKGQQCALGIFTSYLSNVRNPSFW